MLLAATPFAVAAESPKFAELIVDAGFKVDHPALIANLAENGSRHLVLAGQDQEFRQRISIYRVDDDDKPEAVLVTDLTPATNLIAYDVAQIGDRDVLLFLEPGRILRYDLGKAEFVEFLQVSSFYRQDRTGEMAPLNFFRDINLDERDDLILPDITGYRIRLQQPDGGLGEETILQESVVMHLVGDNVGFSGRTLFSGNMDIDDLVDLGYWRGDVLGIYKQTPGLRYENQPLIQSSGLDVLSEAEKRALENGRGAVDQKGLAEKDIQSVKDINGDGIPDIITESTFSEGVFDRRNEFSLHLGHQNGERVAFARDEDALIAFEGLHIGLISMDIDGDDKLDLVVRKAKLSFGRVIRALFSGTVPVEVHFFKMADDDSYPDDANFIVKTKVRISRTSGQVDIPAIVIDDYNGDGFQDLILQTAPDRLAFYNGEPTNNLFAKKPLAYEVDLPRNGELVNAANINDDGRADLILRYNESDGEGMVNTVRLLLSRPMN